MFNGSRFFHLLRKWEAEGQDTYIRILREVMDHYFDSIAGYQKGNMLKIEGYFYANSIAYVLDCVGYHSYSIEICSDQGKAFVTLRNTL